MPKHTFPAAAEGMPIFNRRALLAGAAGLTAAGAFPVSAAVAKSYSATHSAEDRLRHHLLMAAQAMDELVPEADCRWFVTMGGKAPFEGRFIQAQRFQLHSANEPRAPKLMIETMSEVMRWQP